MKTVSDLQHKVVKAKEKGKFGGQSPLAGDWPPNFPFSFALTTPHILCILLACKSFEEKIGFLDPSENPSFLINRLAHQIYNTIGQRFEAYSVTTSQWAILKLLKRREGLSQVEIQEELGVEGATVSGMVQRMIRLGLLERRPDPDDKRVLRVFLTERGRSLEQVLTPLAMEVSDLTFSGFSADEQEFFIRLVKRALRNLE